MLITDKYDPKVNVAISVFKDGRLVDRRLSHNVVTNTGRSWLSRLVGSDNYGQSPPSPHTTAKIGYVGLGCGGALQTDENFATGQAELVTVTALQDPVPFSTVGAESIYLKQVDNQAIGATYFPGDFRTRFIIDVAETELSFSNNKARVSNQAVGTSVPISEAGLYLSTANPSFVVPDGGVDPSQANDLIAYNIFDPITVTPNVILRVEWELRF